MLLTDKTKEYLEVKILGQQGKKIKAQTSDGNYIFVYPTAKQENDPIFWEVVTDIAKNQIWLPVTSKLHQLVQSDWLVSIL